MPLYNPEETGVAGVEKLDRQRVPFTFATPFPLTLHALAAGDIVSEVQVVVEVPFDDPAATLTLGTPGTPTAIFAASETSLAESARFETGRDYRPVSSETLRLSVVPGTSTVGSGYVLFDVYAA